MKVRLNKSTLAALPKELRPHVIEWRERWRKSAISVAYRTSFYIEEDATFTAFSRDLATNKRIRAGGEWAGVTELMPGSNCPLPPGCTVMATGFFCGEPWLTIYHNPAEGTANFATWQMQQIAPDPVTALCG